MSVAPCQVCGGAGFIDAPAPDTDAAGQNEERLAESGLEPAHVEKIPCPICSASGNNTGL
jgi:RecJ-like exonuclease